MYQHSELAAQLLNLVYRRRPVRVARDNKRVLAHLAHEEGEFPSGCGLTVAVKAHEHHHRRWA
jgi:hypothetical protein